MSGKDYYSTLGVLYNASEDEIKHAYRKLAIKLHPDTGNTSDDEAFIELHVAYATLIDPIRRRSYDETIAYKKGSNNSTKNANSDERTEHKHAEEKQPEDYESAVFVDGIQSKDSRGAISYIRPGDFVYYPISSQKKVFFFSYKGTDYYRIKVHKVYSKKHNSFRKVPLLIVKFSETEQVVLRDYFSKYWLSQKGFEEYERHQAIVTFCLEITTVVIIIYLVLQIK